MNKHSTKKLKAIYQSNLFELEEYQVTWKKKQTKEKQYFVSIKASKLQMRKDTVQLDAIC